MKFKIPKVIRELNLDEYAPEYAGEAVIEVWVNPPRGRLADFEEIRAELIGAFEAVQEASEDGEVLKKAGKRITKANLRLFEWWAEMWSQGRDPELYWTVEEVQELQEMCLDNDPQLWEFIMRRSFELIREYRGDRRKK